MIELVESRAYIGATALIVFFVATWGLVFFTDRRLAPLRGGRVARVTAWALAVWALGLYAGVKPDPPPPPPDPPPLSVYAKLYARPEWGGPSTNKVLTLTPKGSIEVHP